jgi:hypothetical protein
VSCGVFFEEGNNLVSVDEPLVAINGTFLGEVVVSDRAAAPLDWGAGAAPAVREGDQDVFTGGSEKIFEDAVERVKVLEDFEAAGGVVAFIFDRKLLNFFEITDEIRITYDVDSVVLGIWKKLAERSLVATDIEDGGA